jgi:Tol biopolymer transport system component
MINVDGSGLRQLTHGHDEDPSWSSDGRLIAFTRYQPGEPGVIHTLDVRHGRVTLTVPGRFDTWSYLFPTWLTR